MRTILKTLTILAACLTATSASAAVLYEFDGALGAGDRLYARFSMPQFLADLDPPKADIRLELRAKTIDARRVTALNPASRITITDLATGFVHKATVSIACLSQSGSFACEAVGPSGGPRIVVTALTGGAVRYEIQERTRAGFRTAATIDVTSPLPLTGDGSVTTLTQFTTRERAVTISYDRQTEALILNARKDGLFTYLFGDGFAATTLSDRQIKAKADYRSIANGHIDSSVVALMTVTGTPDIAAAVPEPSTWAMAIAGLGLIGAGLRRRRRGEPAARCAIA